MEKNHFVQPHPEHTFAEQDAADYPAEDQYFVQCLKAIENVMDIDAYIIDYPNRRILYATQGCAAYFGKEANGRSFLSVSYLDSILSPEEPARVSVINAKVYDFFYSLPLEKRQNLYFTQDYKIKTPNGNVVLVNHRGTVLSLTQKGALRLTLCVISYPTNDRVGNAYIKMLNTGAVYEFIASSQKFIEVKTQKLTPKATQIIKLAGNGKTEPAIARELGISVHTVKYHKKQIFARLGVKNTAEAIQWANNQKKMVK